MYLSRKVARDQPHHVSASAALAPCYRSISLYVVGQATLTWKKTTKDAKMI
jgi:hypothetical protein